MEVIKTTLRDVWVINPDVNRDHRGWHSMDFNKAQFKSQFDFNPVEENTIRFRYNVLTGIHYSPHCYKLCTCTQGSIFYVLVNCDKTDKEYGLWEVFYLNDDNRYQIFKHPRYGSGFYVQSNFAEFRFWQDQYYDLDKPDQQTIHWKNNNFGIPWPCDTPILSKRDEIGHYENDIRK